jgi:MFS family permease
VSTAATPAPTAPSRSEMFLFWASFFTLIAAGIGFSVRTVILKDWGSQFGFTQAELGTITGGGLIGFGLAIIFFSFFADRFGYGKLMVVAFLLHVSSAVVTFAATPVFNQYGKEGAFYCLNLGMWLFALGNGTCEAVINPLTATLFPRNKTHWLNILHAGWPGGLILGVVITLGFEQLGGAIRWEYKLGVFLIPVLIYGVLMLGRPFPKSEAKTAGVPVSGMMKQVGMIGFTLGAAFIGLALANLLPSVFGAPAWIGWLGAGAVWLAFAYVTKFAPGHWVLGFLYLMHALVGYVELGTDSWITNITEQVLRSGTNAQLAFIWTNVLMFTLRFFAGPIVHKINPIGLLFASAALGVIGLYLLGHPMVDSVWPWIAAVTIYGIGKTFYWPTLLGVISERFPKGGALALGLSGGIGMISAGIFGGPGIGYKQDYFAVDYLQRDAAGQDTYGRYVAKNDKGELDKTGFPFVSDIVPDRVPKVAGIDNAKYKVFQDYAAGVAPDGSRKPDAKPTTLENDLQTIRQQEQEGKPVEAKLKSTLENLEKWWLYTGLDKDKGGLRHFEEDKKVLVDARLYGAKTALLYTAAVPLMLAIGFMILIVYFYATGGYKQVHLEDEHPPMEEY